MAHRADAEPAEHSGAAPATGENPYSALINASADSHEGIQRLYAAHRDRRNEQQRAKLLCPDFPGLAVDQELLRLERPGLDPGFRDERHCLVLWARPPDHILRLAEAVQGILRRAAPNVWLMPTYRMHLTTLEIAFSKTPDEIDSLVSTLRPALPAATSYTCSHRARLVKPAVSHDLSAFALSFLPASNEPLLSPAPTLHDDHDDAYTYHHLRRDIFDLVCATGVDVGSRYQVPSAHMTLGRFLDEADHDTPEKRKAWIGAIDRVNDWLEKEVWDRPDSDFIGEWVVGHEKGLDARCGTLWYGGGRTIVMGEGF